MSYDINKFIFTTFLIFKKDFTEEIRKKEGLLLSFFFAFLSIILFNFALGIEGKTLISASGGLIWMVVIFSGSLFMGNLFKKETETGTLFALLLSPADRSAIYLGKYLVSIIFLLIIEIFVLALSAIFLSIPVFNSFFSLFLILFFVTIGYCALGTLFSALIASIKSGTLLYPLLLFPFLVPLFIAAGEETRSIIEGNGIIKIWLNLILLFDIIFITASIVLFEWAVEE